MDDNFSDNSSSAGDDAFDDAADHESGIDYAVDSAADRDGMTDGDVDATEVATWTRPDSTGVPSVDAAIDELARLDELPTGEHVAVYEGLHRQLQDALADLDGA